MLDKLKIRVSDMSFSLVWEFIIFYQEIISTKILSWYMVKAPWYDIYSNTPLHTKAYWVRSVDATYALLIPGVEYFTLNERWLRFKPAISCHAGSDTMSKNQSNKRLKSMAEILRYMLYTLTYSTRLSV